MGGSPGLSSAVPVRQAQGRLSGTELGNDVPTHTLKPSSKRATYGTAEPVPFVEKRRGTRFPGTPEDLLKQVGCV
jgi:hypothetical protein